MSLSYGSGQHEAMQTINHFILRPATLYNQLFYKTPPLVDYEALHWQRSANCK
jgi:hypothetical protein